jgi:hypothetical protein
MKGVIVMQGRLVAEGILHHGVCHLMLIDLLGETMFQWEICMTTRPERERAVLR